MSAGQETRQPSCIRLGERQIGARLARPFLGRARMRIDQMGDRKTRPKHGAAGPIKQEYAVGGIVTQQAGEAPPDGIADPSFAKPLALQVQEGHLIQGVERSQAGIELEAVDDREGFAEPDMFRSEIAMCIDDMPPMNTVGQNLAARIEKPSLDGSDTLDGSSRQVEAAIEQDPPVRDDRLVQRCRVALGIDQNASCM